MLTCPRFTPSFNQCSVGDSVYALGIIRQSPFSPAPSVPRNRRGIVVDLLGDENMLMVDFGEPYGTVLTDVGEIFW